MDREELRRLVLEVLREEAGAPRVRSVRLPSLTVRPEDRLDTGNPQDLLYTRDLFTLEESPRLGA